MSLPSVCQASELSGRITAADGVTPLQGIEVQARIEENSWFAAFTDINGEYQFLNLPVGTYRIRIEDNNLNTYIPEWYENAANYASATPFALLESTNFTGINASLAPGARLTGSVIADGGGAPLSNIRVAAFRATSPSLSNWEEVKSRSTLSDGSYDLGWLEGGTYRLRFSDDAGNYAPEHHDNQIEFDNAGSILLPSGGTVSTNASLANASKIQGTVTDESGANPLAGIYVYAYRNDGSGRWPYVNRTTTQTNGSYDLKGLTAGDYRIEFYDESGLHQREYHDDETNFDSATVLSLATGVTLTGYDAALAGAGLIEGTVTDGSGIGIPAIYVYAYRYNTTGSYWEYVSNGYTDENGNYLVGGLAAGDYRVGAFDDSRTYDEKYYNDKPDIGSADDVSVTVGSTTLGIDIVLEESVSGSISGTITDSSGNTLAGIEVALFRYNTIEGYWETLQTTTTDGTGTYRFEDTDVGSYRLRFRDPSETYAEEFHSNKYNVESALDVEVTDDNETVVNGELADAASISGTVTNNAATPVPGITVNLLRFDSSTVEWVYLLSRATDANGAYSFGGLMNGTFMVEFADYNPSVTYAREYYNGKPTLNGADPVAVLEGQDVTGIDASLDLAGQLSGTVIADANSSPIQLVSVTARRLNEATGTWDYASGASTNAFGIYSMQGLTPGSYRVEFEDISGNYLREFYNDKATFALADSFVISSGVGIVINASLATASRIEGMVTEEGSSTPLPNITVKAHRVVTTNSFEYVSSATTDQNGNYSVAGLAAGTYRISFEDSSDYHFSEVYENATGLGAGTNIEVAAVSTTSDINAALIAGGKISGTVTNALTLAPLEGIGVYLYRFDGASWQHQNYAETDSAGNYTSPALPVGQYRVEFYDNSEAGYRTEFYENAFDADDAIPVTVDALQTSSSKNGSLSPISQSSVIAGTITDNSNSAPLAGIFAQAFLFNAASGRYEFNAEAISDSNGAYSIENLPSGLFRVRFMDRTNGVYAQQFYLGASTLSGASEINLDSQASVGGIDAALSPALTISGTVRNESGGGIEGVGVFVRRWEQADNSWFLVNSAQTLADGTYIVKGLSDGTYRVEFSPSVGSGYYREFYDDVQAINSATDLYVYQNINGSLTDIDAELSATPPATVTPVMSGFRKVGAVSYESDFQGQPGTMYRLERSATMLPMSWVPDGAPFEAQPGGDVLNMTSTEPRMFWRVREQ